MNLIWVIAVNTYREIMRDRILYGLLVFALLLIGLSLALGQLTFAEQVRISADFGLAGIHLSAVILSIFIGSTLVAKEIEKKTIMTLLVRPISRLQFLLGKSLGLVMVISCLMFGLALVLAFVFWGMGFSVRFPFFGGLWGVLLESIVLLGCAIFFSSFASPFMVVSFVVGLFLIGHWMDSLLFFSSESSSYAFKGLTWVITHVLPDLERFNWRSMVVYNDTLEIREIGMASLYALCWFVFFISGSLLIIRRKDFG